MMTILRRSLAAALIAALAGIGIIVALLGRQPRRHVEHEAELLVPTATPQPVPESPRSRQSAAVGVVCLLLLIGLAGIVYESRYVILGVGSRAPDGAAKPLAALSSPDARTAPNPTPAGEMPTKSVRTPAPDPTAGIPRPQPPASLAPDFDVVRVEPNGEAVIAGRAEPNAVVEVLLSGKPVANTRADAHGHFTLTPPPLPTGNSEIVLRAADEKGDSKRSTARVAVVIAPSRDAKPLVAITAPGKPTLVLSQPDARALDSNSADVLDRQADRAEAMVAAGRNAPNPGPNLRGSETDDTAVELPKGSGRRDGGSPSDPANSTREPSRADAPGSGTAVPPTVVSIDAQDGGKLFVTARGAPGAAIRLYLNETLIAPATVGSDGTVTFTVGRGVRPGDYRVRLDLVDPATGKVRDRAEVPFTAPSRGHDEGVEYSAQSQDPTRHADEPHASEERAFGAATPPDERGADQPKSLTTGSLAANMPQDAGTVSSNVKIAEIETARIRRGDSLWRISRRTYGEGERYTLIYDANKKQIRDPDLIYPGQVFVMPPEHGGETVGDGRPY